MKKIIKLSFVILVIICLLLPLFVACNKKDDEDGGTDRLVIYNWEDYIDSDLLDEFAEYYEEVTGNSLEITYTTFDTNETMMTKVLKGDANVDLICPSDYAIEKLLKADCLLNQKDIYNELKPQLDELGIDFEGMSSLGKGSGNIEDEVIDVITDMFSAVKSKDGKPYTEYMTPYMWGTLGILYNVNIVSEEELDEYGWGVLWNVQENEELENKILMKDSVRDTYAAAVLYMKEYDLLPEGYGYEDYSIGDLINCTDDAMLSAAEKVLTEQREHISGYEVDFGKDDMLNEIVYADFAWSGDALWAIEESYDEETDEYLLGYYVPEIGSNIWYDGWVIPTSVNNKLAAMMFIEYMCQPMSAARNSMEIGYTSAADKELMRNDVEVCEFLEENEYDVDEYFEDEGRYPEINEKLGVMRDFGTRGEALVQMWQRAKSGNGVSPVLWWCLLGITGGVGLAFGIYFLVQSLRYRPRKIKPISPEKNNE